MNPEVNTEQRLASALGAARAAYSAALAGHSSGDSNDLVFLGAPLRVDRRRRIVATRAEDRAWTAGSIDTDLRFGTLLLRLFVGTTRYLEVDDVVDFLVEASGGPSIAPASETAAALFVNLCVVEPYLYPDHELAIWLAIAAELAGGRTDTNVHPLLPGLLTDTDPLDETAAAPATAGSGSAQDPGGAESRWIALEAALVSTAVPDSAAPLAAAASDQELRQVLDQYRPAAWDFVGEHLLGAVDRAVHPESAPS